MEKVILTDKEKESVKILVRLGDSEKLAIETVLKLRNQKTDKKFYLFAYEN